jgi:hypothetical protein
MTGLLTLGGGFGWLEGKFGMTVDNVFWADGHTSAKNVMFRAPRPDLPPPAHTDRIRLRQIN